ncbi:MAG: roadblock/LC7 domain-containing protein [Actinomycetes bacterium]
MTSSADADDYAWLVNDFAERVAGVSHAVVVSADGLLVAMSHGFPRDRADQLAAIAAGLVSLTQGAAYCFMGGQVRQTVVEMEGGFLFVMAMGDGSSLAVLASPTCDIGVVGYEMALLVVRAGEILTPDLRAGVAGSLER